MHFNTKLRILEFIVAGILLDLLENAVVLRVTTGETMAIRELAIAIIVIIPFAFLTEFVIDHPRFWHRLFRRRGHKFDHLDLTS